MDSLFKVYIYCIISIFVTATLILLGAFVNYNYGWCGILIALPFTIILMSLYWSMYNDK